MKVGVKHRAVRLLGHQHWITRGRNRVVRWLCDPETVEAVPFEVDFFGFRYPGSLDHFIDWNVFFYGAYSTSELMLLRDAAVALKRSGCEVNFYDVGANVGQHSLFMSALADRIFSFEPFEAVRTKLDEKIKLNEITNITIFPVALGDTDADLEYHEPAGTNMATGSFAKAPYNFSGKVTKLPVRHGDTFVAQNARRPMTLLKLDVEGYEARVIRGLDKTLREDRPVILMEMSEETRKSFGTEDSFRKQLYENHAVFEVAAKSISGSYRLKPFDFQSSGELCVIPAENAEVLRELSAAAS